MVNQLYVLASWGPRKQPIEVCAGAIVQYLCTLASFSPLLTAWREGSRSRTAALGRPVEWRNPAVIERILLEGRNRRDDDGSVIEELGFSTGLWNGQDGELSAGISITCGAHTEAIGLPLPNSVNVKLPRVETRRAMEEYSELLRATVGCWDPEWAAVSDFASMPHPNPGDQRVPEFDWMLFISKSTLGREYSIITGIRGGRYVSIDKRISRTLPRFEPPTTAEPFGGDGWIIVTQNEPVDWENCEHRSRVARVREALGLPPPGEPNLANLIG